MENRDNQKQQKNMAEAAVESPAARFFCHRCTAEISPVLPDYICPQCQSGFIEELQSSADQGEESDDDIFPLPGGSDEDYPRLRGLSQVADLWNMLSYMRRPDEEQNFNPTSLSGNLSQDFRERHQSRPGPSRRLRSYRVPNRRGEADTARNRTEGFLHHLVSQLTDHTGLVGNAGFPVFLNLHSNPGDYAWGRGGWNAIITQLINQLDGTGPPPLSKEKIDEIPFVNISQEQVDKNLQCTVCMEDFKFDEGVRRLTCDHHFHNECIKPWLELHGTCPICRKLLNEGSSSQENTFGSGNEGRTEDMETDASRRNDTFNPTTVYDFTEEFD